MKRPGHSMIDSRSLTAGATLVWLLCVPAHAAADMSSNLPAVEAARIVVVRETAVHDNVVTGEVVNNSSNRVRNVELLIRRIWHWQNEFRPGENAPGAADYYTVAAEIPSGSSERFTYRLPSPLPFRSDGYFETVVTVAGFTEIKERGPERKNIDDWRPISGSGSREHLLSWTQVPVPFRFNTMDQAMCFALGCRETKSFISEGYDFYSDGRS